MARRRTPRQDTPPAAVAQPVVLPLADGRIRVVIRAGHTHRGVTHDGVTAYAATADEVALLKRYDALVES